MSKSTLKAVLHADGGREGWGCQVMCFNFHMRTKGGGGWTVLYDCMKGHSVGSGSKTAPWCSNPPLLPVNVLVDILKTFIRIIQIIYFAETCVLRCWRAWLACLVWTDWQLDGKAGRPCQSWVSSCCIHNAATQCSKTLLFLAFTKGFCCLQVLPFVPFLGSSLYALYYNY